MQSRTCAFPNVEFLVYGNIMIKEDNIDVDSVLVFLPGVKIFLDLENRIIESMAERMSLLRFDKGEYLIEKGNPGQYMLLVKQGRVLVELGEKDIILKKGAVLGEMALLSGKPSKADVIAQTETEVFALHRNDFQELMTRYTKLASVMTLLMKSRISEDRGIQSLGKYQILGRLGEGGMAIVYNAFDPDLEREVAIKMLKYEIAAAEDFKERFRQEAKIIARLNHPNILHVIETIEDYSTIFIVMEKLEGYDLSYYLKHQGIFGVTQTCEILYQVAMALDHANNQISNGIIHRDVKLSNIVMDYDGHVKLTDFGIASTKENVSEHYEGTVLYMAPELLQGKPIDHRVDIYALGITAYAMLTGKTPFRSSNINDVIEQHIKMQPTAIEHFVPDIPTGLSEFIERALIKDPEERISDWHEIKSLLASGKGGDIKLEITGDKDMAIVIKMKSDGIDTTELLNEIENALSKKQVTYEVEIIKKESPELDFTFE